MSPLYHNVRFAGCPASLTGGPLTVPTLSVGPIKDNQKARLNALAVLGLRSCLLILPGRRRTLKPPDACFGVAQKQLLPAESTTAGHPRVGLACLARCHACLTAQFRLSLCGLLGLRPSRPLATWSPLAITLVVLLLLLVLRLTASSLASTLLRHCVQYVLSCLTVFRRLLLPN